MKVKPRCDEVTKGVRCPNSAGFVPAIRAPGGWNIRRGKFCRTHVGEHGERCMTIAEAKRHGVPVDLTT